MPNWYTTRIALDADDLENVLTGGIMDFNRFIPVPKHIEDGEDGKSRFFWIWEHWGTAKNAEHTEIRHYPDNLAIVQFETAWGGLSHELFVKLLSTCQVEPIIEYVCADDYNGVTAVTPSFTGTIAYTDYPQSQSTRLFKVLPAREYYNDPDEGDWFVPDKDLDSVPDPQALASIVKGF